MGQFTIGQVAAEAGLTTSTLRYYERRGVIEPVGRTHAGYRLYDDRSLARLQFVARAKELGCSLDEIVDLAHLWEREDCEPVQARLHALVSEKIGAARRRTDELATLTVQLEAAATTLAGPASDGPCRPTCACVSPTPAPDRRRAPPSTGVDAASCTLPDQELEPRLARWDTVLAHVRAREVTDDGALRLLLDESTPLDELVGLAQDELGCCSFFSFTLTLTGGGAALEVRAPAQADEVVAAVFGAASIS